MQKIGVLKLYAWGVRACCVVGLLASTAQVSPVFAGLFSDDEARSKIEVTRQHLDVLRERLDSFNLKLSDLMQQSDRQGHSVGRMNLELIGRLEELKSDYTKLRGELELSAHSVKELEKRQNNLYVDLDNRLRKLEQVPKSLQQEVNVSSGVGEVKPDRIDTSSQAIKDFDSGLAAFKASNFDGAIETFKKFLITYPDSRLLGGATYWLASAYYAQGDNKKALALFKELLSKWPSDTKAPDAAMNIAIIQYDSGNKVLAKKTLEDLLNKYPKLPIAKTARTKLDAWAR